VPTSNPSAFCPLLKEIPDTMDPSTTKALEALTREALDARTFTACAISIREAGAPPGRFFAGVARPDSLFDLASLTKPLATTLLALRAIEYGEIRLEEEASRFLRDCPSLANGATIEDLLCHRSGLPAIPALHLAFPDSARAERKKALETLCAITPIRSPKEAVEYSCTGFLIFGLILERIGGARLSELFRKHIAAPLALEGRAMFIPEVAERSRCIPTEFCSWRRKRMQGEVHDESAWCLGGDGGNAGLFATLEGVEKLFGVYEEGGGILRGSTVRDARRSRTDGMEQRRGLGLLIAPPAPGWDQASYGHTGFVGNSIWHDPSAGRSVIILSNRVYYGREESLPKIQAFRTAVHSLAAG
jgi:CubicO group peptidase (beta-lactamase class C family)